MNYEILVKTLFVRKKLSRSIWKSEVVIIDSGARFGKVDISNLVEAVLRKLKTSVPFMICSSTGSSQWVRFIFFSRRYNEVKQFKWHFASLATISSSDSFAIRLKSLRFCAAFLTLLCSSSVWFYGSSFLPQKKHSSKVFLKSRLFRVFLLSFLSTKFILQLTDFSSFSFSFEFRFQLTFCLLCTAIHDLWNKALFSKKTSASVNLFCRALHFYLKHLVNHQNSGTHLNYRLS